VVYAAANILQLTACEPPRPILPLTNAERQRVEEALEALSGLETAP
jgi:4-hydroxy-tetrahydrodipicolinate synthase